MNMVKVNSVGYILLRGETAAVRFWFGLTTIFFGLFMTTNSAAQWEYLISFIMLPHWAWGIGFITSGLAVFHGAVTSRCSKLSMFLEAILGTVLWVSIAVSSMMSQGSPGAVTIAALMSVWLLIRYPAWKSLS